MTEQEYRNFMADPDNIGKCDHCPANREMETPLGEDRKPCGQYHCWVWIHNRD